MGLQIGLSSEIVEWKQSQRELETMMQGSMAALETEPDENILKGHFVFETKEMKTEGNLPD
jgi:hypothetical protein